MTAKKKSRRKATAQVLSASPLRMRIDNSTDDVQINIIPLIDVIFCILTFFILAAVGLSRQQAINVDLPRAETGVPQARQLLIVSLDNLGNVFIEQQPVRSREEFLQRLRDYMQRNPDGLMSLYASPSASYDQVVQLLDLLRSVGGDRVALATLPAGSQITPSPTPTQLPTVTPGTPRGASPTPPGVPQNINPNVTPPGVPQNINPNVTPPGVPQNINPNVSPPSAPQPNGASPIPRN